MYRNIVYLMIASVIIIHLLLSHVVLCDYETIWNAYFERPCCKKDFMKYHSGELQSHHLTSNVCDGINEKSWLFCFVCVTKKVFSF